MSLSIITLSLLISLISTEQASYSITLSSPNQYENGTIPLIRGVYTPINIEIIPLNQETSTPMNLILSTSNPSKFQIPNGSVNISTQDTRLISTYLGIPCTAEFTPEEQAAGLSVGITDISCETCAWEKQPIILIEQLNEIEIIASSKEIPNYGFGVFTLRKTLYFVDEIQIRFEYDSHGSAFEVENPMVIPPHYNPDSYTNIMAKYKSLHETGNISNIEIKAKIDIAEFEKCYKITANSTSFTVSVNSEAQIVNTKDLSIPLWFRSELDNDNSVFVSSIEDKIISNTLMSCVITDNDDEYPSEENIKSQNYDEIKDNFRYFRLFFGDNIVNFNLEFNTLNRYFHYKYKCALENNIFSTRKNYTYDFFGSKRSINFIDAIEYKPQCIQFNYSLLENETEIEERLRTYTLNKLYLNETSFSDNSCLDVRYQSFKTYYSNSYGKIAYLCIYPSGLCRYLLNKEKVSGNIENVFEILLNMNELKSKLSMQTDVQFNSIKKIEYLGSTNETMINVFIKEKNKDYIVVDMEMKNEAPFKCEYDLNEYKGNDAFYFNFHPEHNPPVIQFSSEFRKHTDIKILYPEKTENKLHSLNFKCSYFPDIRDLNVSSYSFSYFFINRNDTSYFNCSSPSDSINNKFCLNNKQAKLDFLYVHTLPPYLSELLININEFDNTIFEFKELRLNSIINNMKKNSNDISKLFKYFITLEVYISRINCMKDENGFDICINKKNDYHKRAFETFVNLIGENYTEFFNKLSKDQQKDIYYGIFMYFISMLNNIDSLEGMLLTNHFTTFNNQIKNITYLIQNDLTDENKELFIKDINLLLSNFTSGYNDYISYCINHKLISDTEIENIYEQFTSKIFENFIIQGQHSITTSKYLYKYESSNQANITTHNGIYVQIDFPNNSKETNTDIQGHSIVYFNQYSFFTSDDISKINDFVISVRPFYANNTLSKINPTPIANKGKIRLVFNLTMLKNNEVNTCYRYSMKSKLTTSKVTSKYNINKKELICESEVFSDFVIGKEKVKGSSNFMKYIIIGFATLLIVICVLFFILRGCKRQIPNDEIQEINSHKKSGGDVQLLPSKNENNEED